MNAVNKSSVNYLIRKHTRKKHKTIADTLKKKPGDGLLLEAIVYRQKYGTARMFWSRYNYRIRRYADKYTSRVCKKTTYSRDSGQGLGVGHIRYNIFLV